MATNLHKLRSIQRAAARRAELAAIPAPPADPDIRPDGLPFLDTFDLPIDDDSDFLTVLQALLPRLERVSC